MRNCRLGAEWINNALSSLVPEKWKELPLPVIYRRSLMGAVEDLPVLLNYAPAIDEEVEGFTQNGGWQKINNLLPLLYGPDTWLFNSFDGWIDALNHFTDQLKVSHSSLSSAGGACLILVDPKA